MLLPGCYGSGLHRRHPRTIQHGTKGWAKKKASNYGWSSHAEVVPCSRTFLGWVYLHLMWMYYLFGRALAWHYLSIFSHIHIYIYIYCITFRSIIDIRCKSLLTKMEVSVKETNVPVSEHWGLCGLPVAVANVGAHGMGLFLLRKLRHDGHHSQTSHLGESSKLNFNCEWATLLGPSISGN